MRLLIVEDEPKLNELLTKKFISERYSVDSCLNGRDAIDYILAAEYDTIILDIMLPIINGLEVLREIRKKGIKTPVLLLTARDKIEQRVEGLEAGADDYLVKPFAFEELVARVKVLIRRSSGGAVSNVFTVEDLTVDCDARSVKRGDKYIELATKEFDILEYMIRNSGIVLTREKIINHIWNFDYDGVSNLVDVYIRYLRKKIDDGYEIKLIHTIRGSGYVLRGQQL